MKRALLFLLFFIPFWVNGQGFTRKFYDKTFLYTHLDDDGNLMGPGFSYYQRLTKFYKFNKAGDTVYTRKYPEPLYFSSVSKILPLQDKTYLFFLDKKIAKTDTLANILWEKPIHQSYNYDDLVFEDIEGNLIFPNYDLNKESYISKYNANGDSLWSKSYPFFKITHLGSTNYGYMGLGSGKGAWENISLAGITRDGDTLWTKKLLNFKPILGRSKNGKFIAIAEELPTRNSKILFFNENGDSLWTKTISIGTPYKLEVSENAFFLANFIQGDELNPESKISVSKIDFSGNTLWKSDIPLSFIYSLTSLSDGGFIVTCSTYTRPMHTLIVRADKNGKIHPNYITGKIINDINNDCIQDAGEAGIPGMQLKIEPDNSFAFTNNKGEYSYPADTGVSYKITPLLAIDQTSECHPFRTVSFGKKELDSLNNNFYIKGDLCPKLRLNANISLNKVRCFTGASTITCSNFGTIQAENVEISIEAPSTYVIKNASIPFSLSGNKYVFKASNIDPNKELKISITDSISCNAQLGESAYIRSTVSTSTSPV